MLYFGLNSRAAKGTHVIEAVACFGILPCVTKIFKTPRHSLVPKKLIIQRPLLLNIAKIKPDLENVQLYL